MLKHSLSNCYRSMTEFGKSIRELQAHKGRKYRTRDDKEKRVHYSNETIVAKSRTDVMALL